MHKRAIPTPAKPGSRTPEEIQEAVRKVMGARSDADWEFLRSHPLDPTNVDVSPRSTCGDGEDD
jgi:hypothetical protein